VSKLVIAVLALVLLVGFGCHKDHKMKSSSADACAHCDRVQKATADGKCPVCGMKVSKDACSQCAGVQTATPDGQCPACGKKL
jgi:hypothetical protein